MSYKKGANWERHLAHLFLSHNFCVVRSAGSGHSSEAPDLLVFKHGVQYAIEVKAHGKEYLNISKKQIELLKKWEETSCIQTLIAWKKNREEWRFIPLFLLTENKKGYSISWKKAEKQGMKFKDLI